MPQYLKLYGEQLVELGYTVLPIKPGSKRPDIKDWPRHATTGADVVKWYSNGRAQHGVGINARNTPAIDVDVLDPEVAQAMSDAIDQVFPGVSLMTRTGLAPKFLIPFRSDEPFRKLSSQTYTDGRHDHKVEILGDGQQWVAYHIHPGTGRPYEWFDGINAAGIQGVEHAALPELTRSDAQRVIDAFELLAAERVAAGDWSVRVAVVSPERVAGTSQDDFAPHTEPVKDLSRAQIETLVHKLDFDSREQWVRAGRMLHHQYDGEQEGFEIWEAWSANSGKYNAENQVVVWDSFGQRHDAPETFRSLIKEFGQPAKEAASPVGDFVQAAQFATDQKVEWHVKHVIPKRGLIVVYGAPGSSKSFFVLDLVAHVARGLEWRGHKVKQSKVAYVAAEGVAGFGNRLAAYSAHHDLPLADLPVFVRGGSLMLNESAAGIAESVNSLGGVGIVVIDTLAAVTPGANENTSEDMGEAIKSANIVMEATGASVILIHHANKQGEIRGWSGLLAAADNSIRVEHKEDTGARTAYIEKQKEGKSSGEYRYRLHVVDLGQDEDGDVITSCVVEECTEAAPKSNAKKERKPRSGDFETSDNYKFARVYLQIITDLIGLDGADIDEADAIKAIQGDEILNPMGYEDTPAVRGIKRTLHTLGEKGKIRKEGRWIRLCAD